MPPKAGDAVPDVTLQEGTPGDEVKLKDLFAGKKGILFGVPGAFTPGCSKTHLPGYVSKTDALKEAGAEVVACVTVNDAFVAQAWAESAGAVGKVHVLADPHLELTKALDVVLDAEGKLGTKRCKRFSAVIVDNTFKAFNVEPDGGGLTCSLVEPTMAQLKAA
ncbi:hypothetical protein WJX81_003739 [Elliptochloris bilobata]|uniref:Glutaredoxin-dependent peroxiredoxin n=1 Tax=Elliptochloris bilobata TaxID=381761 RepID=A0AAW1QV73_9CHLO